MKISPVRYTDKIVRTSSALLDRENADEPGIRGGQACKAMQNREIVGKPYVCHTKLKNRGYGSMETDQGLRWIQRLASFTRALSQLDAAVSLADQRPLSELEKQGLIHSFANTHELGWNVLRDYLKDQGTQQLFGSKDTVRAAFAVGLIDDGEAWMEMIRDRNRSSHTYNVDVANAIVSHVIKTYIHTFKDLRKTGEGLKHEIKT